MDINEQYNLISSTFFFEIFGCARHSPNKFGSALACTKISLSTRLLKGNIHYGKQHLKIPFHR